MNIINLSDLELSWNWLRDEFKHRPDIWHHYSSLGVNMPKFVPKRDSIARMIAASSAVNLARNAPSMLVSHGPRPALYAGHLAKVMCPDTPHLVYSFNFTNLPQGAQRRFMASAFKQPTKFVTYSTVERQLYADYFELDIEKIDMLHWAVHAPKVDLSVVPIESGRYICALGSQGRDYATLINAMKKLPHIKLVLVASAESIKDLNVPNNVKIHSNVPLSTSHNILAHSAFMVLPLRDAKVPCGHVTIVSAMFFKKAILVTNSTGVHDYIRDHETGLFFEPNDPDDLARKIEALWSSYPSDSQSSVNQSSDNNPNLEALGQAGYDFAHQYCTEQTATSYFERFLKQHS